MSRGVPEEDLCIVGGFCGVHGTADPHTYATGRVLSRCDKCRAILDVGDWPYCPHGRMTPARGFEPRFDYGLGEYVTGWGDVRKAMRENHLDFRDHPTPAQTSGRRDKISDQQKRTR